MYRLSDTPIFPIPNSVKAYLHAPSLPLLVTSNNPIRYPHNHLQTCPAYPQHQTLAHPDTDTSPLMPHTHHLPLISSRLRPPLAWPFTHTTASTQVSTSPTCVLAFKTRVTTRTSRHLELVTWPPPSITTTNMTLSPGPLHIHRQAHRQAPATLTSPLMSARHFAADMPHKCNSLSCSLSLSLCTQEVDVFVLHQFSFQSLASLMSNACHLLTFNVI